MSRKKESPARRSFQVEAVVSGTVDEVWRAIATGPGVSSWFATCEVEERVGGEIRGDMGMGTQRWGAVTVWDPPHRFVSEGQPMGEDGPTFASEWTVEALSGGTCRVRMVQSLFADSDEWDDELDRIERGWGALEGLRLYLEHFAGEPSADVRVLQPTEETVSEAWRALAGALGLHDAAPGQRWNSPDREATSVGGIVELLQGDPTPKALLRLDPPTRGIALFFALTIAETTFACLVLYLYGEDAASVARREDPLWRAWFAERFPSPAGS